jgi:hypothetical protein
MFESLEQQYRRQLNNWLFNVAQTVNSVQFDKNATYEEKLKALDLLQRQIAEAKRAVIFLINKGAK